MSWKIKFSNSFKHGFKNLEQWLKLKTQQAIDELSHSNDPTQLGRLKKGELQGCYGYDLSSDCRILYFVEKSARRIDFLRVCSHKEVYRE